ncbi:MAG: hypothetical protein WKG07_01815 [Hymenobacter sp.]
MDSILSASCHLAKNTGAKAISRPDARGLHGLRAVQIPPQGRHFYLHRQPAAAHRALSLVWGVRGFYYDRFNSTDSHHRGHPPRARDHRPPQAGRRVRDHRHHAHHRARPSQYGESDRSVGLQGPLISTDFTGFHGFCG